MIKELRTFIGHKAHNILEGRFMKKIILGLCLSAFSVSSFAAGPQTVTCAQAGLSGNLDSLKKCKSNCESSRYGGTFNPGPPESCTFPGAVPVGFGRKLVTPKK